MIPTPDEQLDGPTWRELPGNVWRREDRRRGLVLTVTRTAGAWLWLVLDAHGDPLAHGEGATAQDAMAEADRSG